MEKIIKKLLLSEEANQKMEEILRNGGKESDQLQNDLRELEDKIKEFKHNFSLKDLNKKYLINLSNLQDLYDDIPNIENLVNDFNKNAREGWAIGISNKKRWILEFPYKIIYDLFKEFIVDKTSDYIKKIINHLNNSKKNKKEIKTIILAGGMSSNTSIIKLFRKVLPEISIISINEPEIAVVKGAIYFAKNPYIISERMARYSIGIQVEMSWKGKWKDKWKDKFDKIRGVQRIYDETRKEDVILNFFSVFYKKYQNINVTKKGERRIYDMNSENCGIVFYKSDFDGPVYVVGQLDEKGNCITEEFGKLMFNVENFDEKEPEVEIEIKLGGTFIIAEIEYLKTKKKEIHTFNFTNNNNNNNINNPNGKKEEKKEEAKKEEKKKEKLFILKMKEKNKN